MSKRRKRKRKADSRETAALTSTASPNDYKNSKSTAFDSHRASWDSEALATLISGRLAQPTSSEKDFWDKLSSLSTFISSVILAVVALIVTTWLDASNKNAERSFREAEAARREATETAERNRLEILQRQQQRTHELDVMAKYLPYLTDENEEIRFSAVQTIRILASTEIATLVAKIDPSPGKTAALVDVAATTTDESERAKLIETLGTITKGRPAFIVQNSRPTEFVSSQWGNVIAKYASTIETACRSTGRIEVVGHPEGLKFVGTGWVASANSIVIPRYVLETLAREDPSDGWVFRQQSGSDEPIKVSINFGGELNGPSSAFELGSVKYVGDITADQYALAIVVVNDLDETMHPPIPMQLEPTRTERGTDVVVIGYPSRDSRKPPEVVNSVFGEVFDVKRVMPGKLMSVDDESPTTTINHDCSTLGGTGGAPLLDLASGKVIGVHVASMYLKKATATPTWKLKDALSRLKSTVSSDPSHTVKHAGPHTAVQPK